MAARKPKKTVSAKSLQNLRPHPEHLKRGGKTPHEFLNPVELLFCQYIADGARNVDAARWAGFPDQFSVRADNLRRRPLVQKTIEEFAVARKAHSEELAAQRREERSIFNHHEYIYRMRLAITHEKMGDLGIAKLLEVGFKSTSEIQPSRNTATATATAGTHLQLEGIDIYKPLWLRESEAKLLEEAKARFATPQLEGGKMLSASQAKVYLQGANGDKDKAREAARNDGWEF